MTPPKKHKGQFTSETAKQAGKASGEARRKNKSMREAGLRALEIMIDADKILDPKLITAHPDLKDKPITMQDAIMIGQAWKATWDVRSAEFIRDTTGQKPKEKLDATIGEVKIINDIPKSADGDKAN